jgi:hypothetical protein
VRATFELQNACGTNQKFRRKLNYFWSSFGSLLYLNSRIHKAYITLAIKLYLFYIKSLQRIDNYMSHLYLTFSELHILPTQCICVFRMVLTINSDLNSINRLGFVAET